MMGAERVDPGPIAELLNSAKARTRADGHAARVLAAADGKAQAELTLEAGRSPFPTDAGLIFSLGDAAALAASASALDPPVALDPRRPPQTLQVSLNLFRPASAGTLTADAELTFRTRTTLIVDVKVRDERRNLVAALAVTQLAPGDHPEASAWPTPPAVLSERAMPDRGRRDVPRTSPKKRAPRPPRLATNGGTA